MYKEIYIAKLLDEGLELELAIAAQEEVWQQRSRAEQGARNETAKQGERIFKSITNAKNSPINNPINNPNRECDGFGKQRGQRGLKRNGICEVCGRKRKAGERQFALHHIAHESEIANAATIEVCDRCHGNIEGQGAKYTVFVMEFGGVI